MLKTIEGYIVTVNHDADSSATSAREQSVRLAEVNTAVNLIDQIISRMQRWQSEQRGERLARGVRPHGFAISSAGRTSRPVCLPSTADGVGCDQGHCRQSCRQAGG
ncbi:hypothetical protein O8B39_25415 [Agrobacterium rhizogenes]|nr:hypothetical protein [Rhizobium rhizogenes]